MKSFAQTHHILATRLDELLDTDSISEEQTIKIWKRFDACTDYTVALTIVETLEDFLN